MEAEIYSEIIQLTIKMIFFLLEADDHCGDLKSKIEDE